MSAITSAAGYADRTARWAAVALGFSLPISTALDKTLLAVVLAGFLAGGAYREKWRLIQGHPVALAALALFFMLLAGALWGDRNPGDTLVYLEKYLDLLWIPLFLYLFRDVPARSYAIRALAASIALVLLWSYLLNFGLIPATSFTLGDAGNPVVTKHRITHNLLMAFGVFLFAQLALTAATRLSRALWAALALLASGNVTLMVQGATGYVVLGALLLYLGYAVRGWRGFGWSSAAVAVISAVLVLVPGPFQEKIAQIERGIAEWRPGEAPTTPTGYRLDFYQVSLAIVREHPLTGVGTGGFPKAYADNVRGSGRIEARNPHNEYLLITVQTGVLGLALLLHLFWRQWRLAPRLATLLETHLARAILLTVAVGCLFNSLLIDHTEGLLYAWLSGMLYAGLQSHGNR